MKRAPSPAALAADPLGCYWVGNTQIVWCRDATTCGTIGWGRPTEADAHELIDALELAYHPGLAPQFDVFMDDRAVEHVDWNAFARVFEYVRERMPQWASRIRRQAVVMPNNASGAALAGVGPTLGVTYPLHFAEDVDDALAWLGWAPGSVAASTVAEIAAIAEMAQAAPALVHRVRAWLEGALAGGAVTIEAAAAALATAPRSLQRALADAGTSFSEELVAARVRVAAELLVTTNDKIEVIARAVGYATASRLAEVFRRRLGQTPAQYRASRR